MCCLHANGQTTHSSSLKQLRDLSLPPASGEGEGTGWTFAPAEVEPMVAAVSSAVRVYREQPERWRALQLRGMADDCSWERAAQQYETVLTEVMQDSVQYTKK